MKTRTGRIMVMAGGTGGHVFPGLTVAQYLIKQGWEVRWLGASDQIESSLIPQYGINISFIHISGIRGKGTKAYLSAPVRIWKAWKKAKSIMRIWRPDVVLGMGGYVSGPGGLAAWSYNIPVVLHEQNSVAGLTNRGLARIACKVLQAFPTAFSSADVVGNPIRDVMLALPEPKVRFLHRNGPIRVLVIGGSQGAKILNQVMPIVAARLSEKIILWHQAGKLEFNKTKKNYASTKQTRYKVVEFIDDIASAYAWADIVICRSGAMTVSEISAVGLPAIFVPFMHKDRQQYWNAYPLETCGAATIIEQHNFTAERVCTLLTRWDRSSLLVLAERAKKMAVPNSTEKIAEAIVIAAGV